MKFLSLMVSALIMSTVLMTSSYALVICNCTNSDVIYSIAGGSIPPPTIPPSSCKPYNIVLPKRVSITANYVNSMISNPATCSVKSTGSMIVKGTCVPIDTAGVITCSKKSTFSATTTTKDISKGIDCTKKYDNTKAC